MPIPTPTQSRLLAFLRHYATTTSGESPSYRQIAAAMGWSSVNSVSRILDEMEREGWLQRSPGRNRSIRLTQEREFPRVPLAGIITAGHPINQVENPEWLEIPPYLAGHGENFALRVSGDSMRDDGILDGDIILVERRSVAENGEIVVALVDGCETTVKRFFLKEGVVTLNPANPTMAPLHYLASRVAIQGVVVGQMRSYRRGR
ncbi:MAG: repressor LexA [Magnetococcales bacterium]|nr:repressor LexA [Magnetococcales bacterium]